MNEQITPESATLLELCNMYPVSAMTISGSNTGETMVLAYFVDQSNNINIYQCGASCSTAHLFFWICSAEIEEGEIALPDNVLSFASAAIGDDWVIED